MAGTNCHNICPIWRCESTIVVVVVVIAAPFISTYILFVFFCFFFYFDFSFHFTIMKPLDGAYLAACSTFIVYSNWACSFFDFYVYIAFQPPPMLYNAQRFLSHGVITIIVDFFSFFRSFSLTLHSLPMFDA